MGAFSNINSPKNLEGALTYPVTRSKHSPLFRSKVNGNTVRDMGVIAEKSYFV
jgi:hypothetical protein